MTFSPFIPDTIPSDDQEDILFNFQSLNNQYSVDHIPFDAISKNGYHKKITFFQNNELPNRISPRAALYPRYITYNKDTPQQKTISELFFQNGNTAADERLMVDLLLSETDTYVKKTNVGIGFKTPWGLIINMCQVEQTPPVSNLKTYNWPIPYSSIVYTVITSPYVGAPVNINIHQSEAYLRNVNINSFQLIANAGNDFSNTKKYYVMAIGK